MKLEVPAFVSQLMDRRSLDIDALAARLDAMDEPDRVRAVRKMGGVRLQARIWKAAAGRATTLEDLVPASVTPGTPVDHLGKNSLPAFTEFAKPFYRDAAHPDVLFGYNEQPWRPVVGPGYFVARYFPERGEVGIDYYDVPPPDARLPPGWPEVRRNERGLSIVVYAKMIDYLRKVSDGVVIGRAVKSGRPTSNYFLLCRTGC